MSSSARPQRTAVAFFLAIAFGGAWALWLVRWWTGVDVVAAGGMVFVGLATFATVRWARPGDTGLGRPAARKLLAQCALALGVVLGLAVTAVLIGTAAGVHRLDVTGLSGLRQLYGTGSGAELLLTALANATALFAVVLPLAFCEEWGWRGFLLPRLIPLGTWPALLLSSVVWGVWHLPGYVGTGKPGLLPFLIFCLPLGVLFGWMRLRFGSIWPSTIAHAANNTFVIAFVNIAVTDASTLAAPDPWSLGLSGWPGWLTMSALIAVVAATTAVLRSAPARWKNHQNSGPPVHPFQRHDVGTSESSGTLARVEQDPSCELCGGTGTMTWQQPVPGPDDALTLTEMSHPCVNGCSGWYQLPAAEQGTVVDPAEETEAGNVAAANLEHRTDWFRPAPPQDH